MPIPTEEGKAVEDAGATEKTVRTVREAGPYG